MASFIPEYLGGPTGADCARAVLEPQCPFVGATGAGVWEA